MRKLRMFTVCALVLGALGATAASASAYSLGPAGTKVTGTGHLGIRNFGPAGLGFAFGGPSGGGIDCDDPVQLSGTLDGSASVALNSTFSNCHAFEGLSDPVTINAPGGMKLSVVAKQGSGYLGQLTTGTGMTFTAGACTLTVPAEVQLVEPHWFSIANGSAGIGGNIFQKSYRTEVQSHPYTGSAGCPALYRGAHTTGFGMYAYATINLYGPHVS